MIIDPYSLVECILAASLFLYGFAFMFHTKRIKSLLHFLLKEDDLSFFLSWLIAGSLLPWGLGMIFTHNDWVWDLPVIVTFNRMDLDCQSRCMASFPDKDAEIFAPISASYLP